MFEVLTGELRAKLMGEQPVKQRAGPGNGRNNISMAATPVTGRNTRYEALHPIRRGALPTDRVQHPTT